MEPTKPSLEKLTKNKKKKLRRREESLAPSLKEKREQSNPLETEVKVNKKKASAASVDEPVAKRLKKEHAPLHRPRVGETDEASGGVRRLVARVSQESADDAGQPIAPSHRTDSNAASRETQRENSARDKSTKSDVNSDPFFSERPKSQRGMSVQHPHQHAGRYEWPEEMMRPLPSLLEGAETNAMGRGPLHFVNRRQEQKKEQKALFEERQQRREGVHGGTDANSKSFGGRESEDEHDDTDSQYARETESQRQARLLWEVNAPAKKSHTQFSKRREPFRKKDPVTRSFEQKQKRNSFKSLM
jgi:hypothetical protein